MNHRTVLHQKNAINMGFKLLSVPVTQESLLNAPATKGSLLNVRNKSACPCDFNNLHICQPVFLAVCLQVLEQFFSFHNQSKSQPPPPPGGGHSGLKGEIGKNLKGFYEAFTRKKTAWPMPLKCNVIFYVNLWD